MIIRIIALIPLIGIAASAACDFPGLAANPHASDLSGYQAIAKLQGKNRTGFEKFEPSVGFDVAHTPDGQIKTVSIRVLTQNPGSHVAVMGDFNQWQTPIPLTVDPRDPDYHIGHIPGLQHGMEYRLVADGTSLLDPAATLFTSADYNDRFKGKGKTPYLNSIFWDVNHPGAYQMQIPEGVDLKDKPVIITEQSLYELVSQWPHNGQVGPASIAKTYQFVADSGIAEEIARGNNAIELLPVAAFCDGHEWWRHYLVYGNYGPDSRFGTPDEFRAMVDAFNRAGVAVFVDIVPSHYPFQTDEGPRNLADSGLHHWKKANGQSLYGDTRSPWNTNRYNYEDPKVRRFLIDGVLTQMRDYGISGIRIDNVDDVKHLPGGYQFLHELSQAIRTYRPYAFIGGENWSDHKNLLRRTDLDQGGGFDATNDPKFFFDFVQSGIMGPPAGIDLRSLTADYAAAHQNTSVPRLWYITNHDESANPVPEKFSGQYPLSLLANDPPDVKRGKIRAFNSLTHLGGSHSLDMLQLQILQQGSYLTNPAVDWSLLKTQPESREMREYFVDLFQYINTHPAFAFHNHHPKILYHTDHDTKVVTLLRMDHETKRHHYVVINLGDQPLKNYPLSVEHGGKYVVAMDSDAPKYGGSGGLTRQATPDGVLTSSTHHSIIRCCCRRWHPTKRLFWYHGIKRICL